MAPDTTEPSRVAPQEGSDTTSTSQDTTEITARAKAIATMAWAALNGKVPKRAALRGAIKLSATVVVLANGEGDDGIERIRQLGPDEIMRAMGWAA